ncbi:iron-sulfur cluster assembly protein [Formivibrio citricus]|uniref:Iron-sulfur cluster assembly protein n=1 Tax=Formivibrio citricus TaxID=83765 RepID=A0A1I5AEQ0_9NEIS|nr:iron-sulfur cluster assembly accessory protein [Formivibrio citricus]SFN60917.1 iron-sulfur cluster assembly protein [Formivibrio citricus]
MSLTITPAARYAFILALQQRGKGNIRLCIHTSGCTGLSYSLEFADEITDADTVLSFGKVAVQVETSHLPHLPGLVIDYVRDKTGEGFKIEGRAGVAAPCNSCCCN